MLVMLAGAWCIMLQGSTRPCYCAQHERRFILSVVYRGWGLSTDSSSRRPTSRRSEENPRFFSDPARTHLRPAEAPSAQIGRRTALEIDTPERSTQTASPNVVALKNRMGHQVDADGGLLCSSLKMDGGQLFSGGDDGADSAHG